MWITEKNSMLKLDLFGHYYRMLSKRAKIEKPNWPYLARHTRVTQIYRDYGAVIGAKMAGHVPGSKQIRTYLHLSESDIEEVLDAANSLTKSNKQQDLQRYNKCDKVNSYGEIICMNCKDALNSAGALVIESEKEQQPKELEGIKHLLEDPQIKDILKALKSPEIVAAVKEKIFSK
jgi:hypothetical protein